MKALLGTYVKKFQDFQTKNSIFFAVFEIFSSFGVNVLEMAKKLENGDVPFFHNKRREKRRKM